MLTGKFYGWMNVVQVADKSVEFVFSVCPNHKYVIYISIPEIRLVGITRNRVLFKFAHGKVHKRWCHPGSHCRTVLLQEMFIVENKIIHGGDHLDEITFGWKEFKSGHSGQSLNPNRRPTASY